MKKSLTGALASASCALIASSTLQAEDPHDIGDWDLSGAFLLYSEADRVQALEPVIKLERALDTNESVSIKLTLDALTGASASGAVPSVQAQTFTRPSGSGDYTTDARQTPLDDTFKDTRAALALSWSRPAWRDTQSELGLNLSREYDYQSIGVSGSLSKGLNSNNTTIKSGIALAADTINPVGGAPVPFALMQPAGGSPVRQEGSQDKTLVDVIAGVTQVIDTHSLFQLNYSFSMADGYLNDAYKIVSVLDPVTGTPLFSNTLEPNLPDVVYESRPDSRTRHGLFGQYKRMVGDSENVLDVSYRFMLDDWGINSHTIDFKYRKSLSERRFIQPHLRLYQQTKADFYTPFFVSGEEPAAGSAEHASADYRLADLRAYTVGLEYGQENQHNSWSVTLEYYLQSVAEPSNKYGELVELELNPDLSAVMFRVLYDF